MTALAPTLQAWFTEYLLAQRGASTNTVSAYRTCMRLLLRYAHQRHGIPPAKLDLAHLDDLTIAAFLDMLEQDRHVSVATRNARLAAIHSLFAYASFRHPEHAELITRVLAIPTKTARRTPVVYLDDAEVDALLDAPDQQTWTGQRDHTMLLLLVTTGIRAAELIGLRRCDFSPRRPAYIVVTGKGRKQRITPLEKTTVSAVTAWLRANPGPTEAPMFPSRGRTRPMSHDAVAQRVALHAHAAAARTLSIRSKSPTPHTLRHTCAMRMLASGLDITTIALWLGHSSPTATRRYLHADLALKQRAIDRTAPPHTRLGRYKPTDDVLAFLEGL